jgi:3-oxoacyl-[acyl-carrier protein] reductase
LVIEPAHAAGGAARDLDGQVAVVTGAARAIGRAIAETLAARGAVVVSIDIAPSEAMVEAIATRGGSARFVVADVTDEDAVEHAFSEVRDAYGRLDVLVNNAGVFADVERRPFWEIPVEEWDRILAVNLRSVFLCSRAGSRPMREARSGRIVNIASNTAVFGMANLLHYIASKAAVVGVTRSMARELGPFSVAVNAVAPGLVTTEVTVETVPEEYRRLVAEGQCLQQPIVPADVAAAVAFLAAPAARMVTGQTLLVNGGATMGPA